MQRPSLSKLLPLLAGRANWPWTVQSPHCLETMAGGRPSPKMSIVAPSFNQAEFIEETIRSVLLQGYPNLEFVIIDGGTDDGSVIIIWKYSGWLSFWLSEPDRGQSHAINKGIARATGKIVH